MKSLSCRSGFSPTIAAEVGLKADLHPTTAVDVGLKADLRTRVAE